MTLTMDDYIRDVVGRMPIAAPRLQEIEKELRSTINERLEHGQSLDNVLRQLGDPEQLAGSYLAEIPLVSAEFWDRAAAKFYDLLVVMAGVIPFAVLVRVVLPALGVSAGGAPLAGLVVAAFGAAILFPVYTVICEWQTGQTLGKRWVDLIVVRESGARISFGQAVVRQLPQFLQMYWIDVAFVLFTDRNQRAFELLSKTRVVEHPADPQ